MSRFTLYVADQIIEVIRVAYSNEDVNVIAHYDESNQFNIVCREGFGDDSE